MTSGDINFIGATSTNNGLTAKISNSEHLHPAGTITVTYNGSVGEAFYQTKPFWASDDVNVLYPKIHFNERIALYILAPLIKKGKSYGYSYKWTKEKMEADEIYLPVTQNRNIDFVFIEERVRELEEERVRELEVYLQDAGFENCTLTKKENKALHLIQAGIIKTKLFTIDELFDIATGRDIIIGRTKEGKIPLISHQHDNNGISKRVATIQDRRLFNYETTLPLADRGVFLATTQAENFHIGTRVKALTFKSGTQSENIRLFFVAAINKLQILFTDYLTNATNNLPNLKISLPVNGDGSIDYTFMETCISAIKKQCVENLNNELPKYRSAHGQRLPQTVKLETFESERYDNDEPKTFMAAEPFECYRWERFDQSIIDFFGDNQTILVGCYKDKQYLDWIHSHSIYNIRLGKTKGSMEANRELFDSTSLLVLYELGKPNKLSAYKITGHHEITKDELIKLDYPNKKPRKSYMAFDILPLEKDLTFLVEHHLIERFVELNANNAKGNPVFIEP